MRRPFTAKGQLGPIPCRGRWRVRSTCRPGESDNSWVASGPPERQSDFLPPGWHAPPALQPPQGGFPSPPTFVSGSVPRVRSRALPGLVNRTTSQRRPEMQNINVVVITGNLTRDPRAANTPKAERRSATCASRSTAVARTATTSGSTSPTTSTSQSGAPRARLRASTWPRVARWRSKAGSTGRSRASRRRPPRVRPDRRQHGPVPRRQAEGRGRRGRRARGRVGGRGDGGGEDDIPFSRLSRAEGVHREVGALFCALQPGGRSKKSRPRGDTFRRRRLTASAQVHKSPLGRRCNA